MKKWFIVGFTGLAAGCGDKCDLAEQLESRAGSGAIDCGHVALGESFSEVDICVGEAFESKRPFFARYDQQGRDSKVTLGIAGDSAGNVTVLTWDSDPSGGGGMDPVINGATCVGPKIGAGRASETTPIVSCERQDSLGMVCG